MRMRNAILTAALAALALGTTAVKCGPAEPGESLRAGACAVDITPVVGVNHSDPIFMAGFNNDQHATGVHDPIWARGIVLEHGDSKIAFVTLDVVGYFYNEVETIRSLVDPALGFASITVTSTHNHEGPDTMGLWGPDPTTTGVDVAYLDFVNDKVVECITTADAAMVPAAIKFATGTTIGTSLPPWPDLMADGRVLQELDVDLTLVGGTGVVHVLGDEGPVTNPVLPVMQLRRFFPLEAEEGGAELGDVIATVTNYASHPESLGSNNTLISSDFPHYAREAIEARYGGIAVHVSADLGVLLGPLDVDLYDPATEAPMPRRTFAFAQRMGELLAGRAIAALEAEAHWEIHPEIAVRSDPKIIVPVENPYFIFAGQLGVFGRRPLVQSGSGFIIETETQLIQIGRAQIVVTPNELDPQIGLRYRDAMTEAEHRFLFGLGNDEIGYQMEMAKFNPSCFECWSWVIFGDANDCPLAATLDCDTVFQNNIGPGADPLLSSSIEALIRDLNP